MNVFRKKSVEVTDGYAVGDQIVIRLGNMGGFFATVQKVNEDGSALFFFDDCICQKPINTGRLTKNFYKTTLGKWLNSELIELFPEDIKSQMVNVDEGKALRLPYYSEMFGHDWYYKLFEPDDCEQLPMMAIRRNRVCSAPDDEYCWYWCMNARKDSAAAFCYCYSNGSANKGAASNSLGVRPAFILKSPAPCARD